MSERKDVGPVLQAADAELVEALLMALQEDNSDRPLEIIDRGGYVRVSCPDECRLRRVTLEEKLGREVSLAEIEPVMASFAGRMRGDEEELVWYLIKEQAND
ncbi:MmoB/DmpM family protein [Mycobacterium sp. SM1]|uniref:MmoB/DmpM family protein n=1 Tax=Mycobacterium sp. SM1 TaxID=2816243 RepID=UPI001BCF5339|nr:MmoB/DmpM family protein [Mycobacterium sp. SM1]MBS4730349.1 MmoB/DmpM family protein [Mycobacterium sp. SM1]